jgi:hypothetical protein
LKNLPGILVHRFFSATFGLICHVWKVLFHQFVIRWRLRSLNFKTIITLDDCFLVKDQCQSCDPVSKNSVLSFGMIKFVFGLQGVP